MSARQRGIVARAQSPRGEVVVRRRAGEDDGSGGRDGVVELRVNGVFVMDSAQTRAERLLAGETLARAETPRRVLVGGLGLGHTLHALLQDQRVEHVTVCELEPAVVGWLRAGVLAGGEVLADPRVEVVVDDVRRLVGATHQRYDVVLLDVDNGPDFLVYDANAAVYAEPFLTSCRGLLADGGALAVWSSTPAPVLQERLRRVFGGCAARAVPVDLQGRREHYWLLTGEVRR